MDLNLVKSEKFFILRDFLGERLAKRICTIFENIQKLEVNHDKERVFNIFLRNYLNLYS